jgi:hypothetical protein
MAKAAAESRTRGCSNFPAVPAKKSTVAKSTVDDRLWDLSAIGRRRPEG